MTDRPPFELQAQDAPRTRERINLTQLEGETIRLVLEEHQLTEAGDARIIVTDSLNWVLITVDSGCGEDARLNDGAPTFLGTGKGDGLDVLVSKVMTQHLRLLLIHGLMSQGEYDVHMTNRAQAEEVHRQRRLNALRRSAEELGAKLVIAEPEAKT